MADSIIKQDIFLTSLRKTIYKNICHFMSFIKDFLIHKTKINPNISKSSYQK
jgi:hypothetical protein